MPDLRQKQQVAQVKHTQSLSGPGEKANLIEITGTKMNGEYRDCKDRNALPAAFVQQAGEEPSNLDQSIGVD
jgi:hypothetical protein